MKRKIESLILSLAFFLCFNSGEARRIKTLPPENSFNFFNNEHPSIWAINLANELEDFNQIFANFIIQNDLENRLIELEDLFNEYELYADLGINYNNFIEHLPEIISAPAPPSGRPPGSSDDSGGEPPYDLNFIKALLSFSKKLSRIGPAPKMFLEEDWSVIKMILRGEGEFASITEPEERSSRAIEVVRERMMERVRSVSEMHEVFPLEEERERFLRELSFEELFVLDYALNTPARIIFGLPHKPLQGIKERISFIRIFKEYKENSGRAGSLWEHLKEREIGEKFLAEVSARGVKLAALEPGVKFKVELAKEGGKKLEEEEILRNLERARPLPAQGRRELLEQALIELSEHPDVPDEVRGIFRRARDSLEADQADAKEIVKEIILELLELGNGMEDIKKNLIVRFGEIYSAEDKLSIEKEGVFPEEIDIKELKREILSGNTEAKFGAMAKYWGHITKVLQELLNKAGKQKYFEKQLVPELRERKFSLHYLVIPQQDVALEIELWARRMEDSLRGLVADDCERDSHYFDTLSFLFDPSLLIFRIKEKGVWVGHIIGVVAKDEGGNPVLVVDVVQLGLEHRVLNGKKSMPKKFALKLLEGIGEYARKAGFRKVVFSSRAEFISNRQDIGKAIKSTLEDWHKKENSRAELFEFVEAGAQARRRYPKWISDEEEEFLELLRIFGFPEDYRAYLQIYYPPPIP